jgi:hypothetical protein
MGDTTFLGKGKTVDTTKKFTIVTQFISSDGTANGNLAEIRRFYVQNGKIIPNSVSKISGIDAVNSITDNFCAQQKTAFGDNNRFAAKGGLKQMGAALKSSLSPSGMTMLPLCSGSIPTTPPPPTPARPVSLVALARPPLVTPRTSNPRTVQPQSPTPTSSGATLTPPSLALPPQTPPAPPRPHLLPLPRSQCRQVAPLLNGANAVARATLARLLALPLTLATLATPVSILCHSKVWIFTDLFMLLRLLTMLLNVQC